MFSYIKSSQAMQSILGRRIVHSSPSRFAISPCCFYYRGFTCFNIRSSFSKSFLLFLNMYSSMRTLSSFNQKQPSPQNKTKNPQKPQRDLIWIVLNFCVNGRIHIFMISNFLIQECGTTFGLFLFDVLRWKYPPYALLNGTLVRTLSPELVLQ